MADSVESLCLKYVQRHDVQLGRSYRCVPGLEKRFPQSSRRRPAMLLHNNLSHLHHVVHIPTGIEFVFCYKPRLQKAKSERILGRLKKIFKGFKQQKLLDAKLARSGSEALKPFFDYLPPFLEDQNNNARRTKANKETFAANFILLAKINPEDSSSSSSLSSSSSSSASSPSSSFSPLSPSFLDDLECAGEEEEEDPGVVLDEDLQLGDLDVMAVLTPESPFLTSMHYCDASLESHTDHFPEFPGEPTVQVSFGMPIQHSDDDPLAALKMHIDTEVELPFPSFDCNFLDGTGCDLSDFP